MSCERRQYHLTLLAKYLTLNRNPPASMSVPLQHIIGIVHFGHACNVRLFRWHASQRPHNFVTPKGTPLPLPHVCGSGTLMLVSSTYKAWVGRISCQCGTGQEQAIHLPHSALKTKSCRLGSPKRTNNLQRVLPHNYYVEDSLSYFKKREQISLVEP